MLDQGTVSLSPVSDGGHLLSYPLIGQILFGSMRRQRRPRILSSKSPEPHGMASAYKVLSKSTSGEEEKAPSTGVKKNKQRVLILSSRGVTYRYVRPSIPLFLDADPSEASTFAQRPGVDASSLAEGIQIRQQIQTLPAMRTR